MTDDNLIAVLLLLGVSSVDVPTERRLNSRSVLVVLLKPAQEFHNYPSETQNFTTNHILRSPLDTNISVLRLDIRSPEVK